MHQTLYTMYAKWWYFLSATNITEYGLFNFFFRLIVIHTIFWTIYIFSFYTETWTVYLCPKLPDCKGSSISRRRKTKYSKARLNGKELINQGQNLVFLPRFDNTWGHVFLTNKNIISHNSEQIYNILVSILFHSQNPCIWKL